MRTKGSRYNENLRFSLSRYLFALLINREVYEKPKPIFYLLGITIFCSPGFAHQRFC